MSSEDKRTEETATVLNRVATAIYPEVKLAPWMGHNDRKNNAVIIGLSTLGDISEEIDRRQWMDAHPDARAPDSKASPDGPDFDASKARGGSGMVAFCLNRLAINTHNYGPSADGIRTRQGIALAKANNPGMATQPGDERKKGWAERLHLTKGPKDQ